MIASLAMYARPETAAATDRYWALIRDGLAARDIEAPERLETALPFMETWRDPGLVFSQTCGRPYRLALHGKVRLVATPDYGLSDCRPGYYRSPFVVRARDARTTLSDYGAATFAYNEKMSQSGWAAPQCHAAMQGFRFENIWQSGGHIASARAVAEGRADIAALDALTWDLIKRYEDFSTELRVLDWTGETPGLPYITGPANDPDAVFAAVAEAIEVLPIVDRIDLRLKGLVRISADDYLSVPNP